MKITSYNYKGKTSKDKIARLLNTVNKLKKPQTNQPKYYFTCDSEYSKDECVVLSMRKQYEISVDNDIEFEDSLRIFCKNRSPNSVMKINDEEYVVNSRINNMNVTEKIRILVKK